MLKLCLGTAQLGMKYGINNQIGRQPTREESFDILQNAVSSGVVYIDTAKLYGNSEEIIGESGILKNDAAHIITKLDGQVHSNFRSELETSLKRLQVDAVDGYLFHDVSGYYNQSELKELIKLRVEGLTKHIGVSVYHPADALQVAKDGIVDYIQIPYSVLDQRLDSTDFFSDAKKNRIKVFARSAFLQGLALMSPDRVPDTLKEIVPYLVKFRDIINAHGFNEAEAAFLFSYTHGRIFKTVFGVDTRTQLEKNIAIAEKAQLFAECRKALEGLTYGIDHRILDPSSWK